MPRAGTARRRREREGLPPAKPGQVGWVHGTKLVFFQAFKNDFLSAVETKTQGAFYSKVAHLYLAKYGYHTAWKDDLENQDDIADDVDPDKDVNELSIEEAESRAEYFGKLKLGVWFNTEYKSALPTTVKKVAFTKLFDKPELEPPAPVKMRTLYYYSRKFYTERVKPRVAARWQALSRLPNPPKMITLRTMVTKEAWLAETQEFRNEVQLALDKEYETAQALNNAAYYLQPFVDAIHDRFGMNVALMLCGPIPDRGGRIEVRSVHVGTSNGLVPRHWSEFDRGGFDVAQRSFVDFSHHCFTEEDCRARALLGAEEGPAAGPSDERAGSPMSDSDGANKDVGPSSGDDDPTSHLPPLPSDPLGTAAVKDTTGGSTTMPSSSSTDIPTLSEEEYQVILAAMGGEDAWANVGDYDWAQAGEFGLVRLDLAALQNGSRDDCGGDTALGDSTWHLGAAARREASGGAEHNFDVDIGEIGRRPGDVDAAGKGEMPERPKPTPAYLPERPTPKPAYRGAPRNEVEQAVLERPEVNPDTEGPLNAEGPKKPVTKDVTAAAAKDKAGEDGVEGGGDGREVGGVWEEEDMSGWPDELKHAYGGFERGQDWGGEIWKACVDALITVERAQGFRAKGWLSVPSGDGDEPPVEVPDFMRYARKWDKPVALTSEIGPTGKEGSMVERWWNWWTRMQPASRMQENGKFKVAALVPVAEWEELGKMAGRNGVLLYVGALLWWGEVAAETEDEEEREVLMKDWRWAVDNVASALCLAADSTISAGKPTTEESDKPKPGKKAKADKPKGRKSTAAKPKAANAKAPPVKKVPAKAGSASKRKQPDVPEDKENEPAKGGVLASAVAVTEVYLTPMRGGGDIGVGLDNGRSSGDGGQRLITTLGV
ncbi:hypothetical protein C8F04DRAFT_1251547 [Mycena alexandri]|uniref:Uncharacterized protein n=1 Tax=Mycena alexandri TaxID=1745969 RepID=A0AAD6TB35_9AGAR|nr:hypothetical protein C8F04DRAFT_1251547 [Mycena alexandri]